MITGDETNKKIKLCLDNLPKNSLLGMSLMKEFKDEQMIADMWKQNMIDGTSFEVGTFHNRWVGVLSTTSHSAFILFRELFITSQAQSIN